MDTAIKNYIDSLDRRSIPWNRMFTAYGTAEHYNELLSGTTSDLWGSLWTGVEKPTSERKRPLGWFAPFGSRRIQISEVEEHEN